MSDLSAFSLTRLYSDLLDRRVNVVQRPSDPEFQPKPIFGTYSVGEADVPLVARVDRPVLAYCAAALAGIPESVTRDQLKSGEFSDILQDGMHEVLNISSTAFSMEGRAVLKDMKFEPNLLDARYRNLLVKCSFKSCFQVEVGTATKGAMTVHY